MKAVLNEPLSQRAYLKRENSVNCSQLIVPECLQDLYKIPTTPANASGNLSVTGFLQEVANPGDLKVHYILIYVLIRKGAIVDVLTLLSDVPFAGAP